MAPCKVPATRLECFSDFYKFYLGEHRQSGTRICHFIGGFAVLGGVATALLDGHAGWVALGIFSSYAINWWSHFRIERNRPASIDYPLWSVRADMRMFAELATGRLSFSGARDPESA
jgi:hypothetical protein